MAVLLQLSLCVLTVTQLTSSQSTYDVIQHENDVNSCGDTKQVLNQLVTAVTQIQRAVSQIQTDVSQMKANVSRTQNAVTEMQMDVTNMSHTISQLQCNATEFKACDQQPVKVCIRPDLYAYQ